MRRLRERPGRVVGVLAAGALLAAGCSDGGGSGDGEEGRGPAKARGKGGTASAAPAAPAPAPAPTIEADPGKQPTSPAEARELVREVIADPALFGGSVERARPYESDPATWSVLGGDCVWAREPLPKDVLATLTRHFVLPAAKGKGPLRLSATVTVHPTVLDAAWEQAGMLEEAIGCSEQTLRQGEKLSKLVSTAYAWGEGGNAYAEDSLIELGECTTATQGGPYPYQWQQATFGPVVVSVSACAGEGWDKRETMAAAQQPVPRMLLRAEKAIGRPVESKSGSSKGSS